MYGGEEFVCVLLETGEDGARVVAEQLRNAVQAVQVPHEFSEPAAVVTTA
jgi:PleD family two-component response regulator